MKLEISIKVNKGVVQLAELIAQSSALQMMFGSISLVVVVWLMS